MFKILQTDRLNSGIFLRIVDRHGQQKAHITVHPLLILSKRLKKSNLKDQKGIRKQKNVSLAKNKFLILFEKLIFVQEIRKFLFQKLRNGQDKI